MNKTISLLILASAALHVLVLGLIDFNSPSKILTAGSLMRISIQAPSPDSVTKALRNNDIVKPMQQHKIAKVEQTTQVKPVEKKITPTKVAQPKATILKPVNDTPTQEVLAANKNIITAKLENTPSKAAPALPKRVPSLLYSDLERAFALHFYYPRIAIKRGWQGDVKISLRIEADGHLTRVRILNSSGHNLLDKAAMSSIDKVEILPAAIALLNGQTLDLILPVEYRLL